MRKLKISVPLFSILIFGALLSCKKSEDLRIPFTNPLDSCSSTPMSGKIIYDHLNNLSFTLEPQWKLNFNDAQRVTGGIDTIASDKYSQVKSFTLSTTTNQLKLYDFFVNELQFMKKDSTVDILSLGQYAINHHPCLYVITKMKEGNLKMKSVFFYVKIKEKIIITQLSIDSEESDEKFCDLMYIVNSIDFNPGLALSERSKD